MIIYKAESKKKVVNASLPSSVQKEPIYRYHVTYYKAKTFVAVQSGTATVTRRVFETDKGAISWCVKQAKSVGGIRVLERETLK